LHKLKESEVDPITLVIAAATAAAGYVGAQTINKRKHGDLEARVDKKMAEAKKEADRLVDKARSEANKLVDDARQEENSRRKELAETEKRVAKREDAVDSKLSSLDDRQEQLRVDEEAIKDLKDQIHEIRDKQQANLEKIAKLKKSEARDKLMEMTERDIKQDLIELTEKLKTDAAENAEDDATTVMLTAMERLASDVTAERTTTAVPLPDDMKGRIIGKEGRNIQAIERLTGVDVTVDDTPGMVVLSCFDPVRRQIGRVTMETLIQDGRVHPGRIEEVYEKAVETIDKEIDKAATEAMREVGVLNLPKDIKRLLGELKFRTSYGQNVLKHSTEMSHLAGMIAAEIGADVEISKTSALLHDIGKAVTHKIEGKHHHVGADLAKKAGMKDEVVHAIHAHHDDIDATTKEAMIIRVVDAISAARPGARNSSSEDFVKRMKELENVTNGFEGVTKSYAISAGREIRVFVEPEKIDDLTAIRLARDVANKIESTLQFPGTIKVNVIRETRAVEFAK